MSSTQERIRRRRQYLKKKGAAYTKMSLGAILFASCAVLAVLLFALALFCWYENSYFGSVPRAWVFLPMCMALSFGLDAWLLAMTVRQARQEAKQLPYIPPITPDDLPAEEVMVRGSEEPAQEQSQLLLRGIEGNAGAGEQGLLRSSQGHRPSV